MSQQPPPPPSNLVDLSMTYDSFMRMVSHELRTPIHLIQGYGELLGQEALGTMPQPQKEAVNSILQSTYRLNRVVENITTLLSLDIEPPILESMSVVEIVVAVMVRWHDQATKSQISLTVNQETNLPLIQANAQQLYQAVDNLVDNALKFTPSGGSVTLKSYQESDWVCLSIEDSGMGIPPEAKARIFSLFYQTDSSISRQYQGIGLGLSVVKSVVEAHGGQVELTSTPNCGSSFIIKLPIINTDTMTEENADTPMGTRHILVVDDEEYVTLVLKDGLESLPNCTVTTASNGNEAIALCQKQTFDLIITDYKMPVTDGLTLADHISQSYPQTKIVMVTAHIDEHLQQRASQVDIQRLLQKPFKLADIRTAASEVLAQNQENKPI